MGVLPLRVRVSRFVVLIGILAAALGCSPAQKGLPLGAAESTETTVAAPRVPAGSPGPGFGETDNLGSFPTFMPPVAAGTETQECSLGTDPYSTCI